MHFDKFCYQAEFFFTQPRQSPNEAVPELKAAEMFVRTKQGTRAD